ncbi:MAG: DUF2442 domain-containing protein [Chloroflexota bacterium]|nr:DUF2442 domain-containing protein [Chloroflexota bacterium]MDE2958480.1 DUF2442 domain-containing protein [Chloroflexota bacterium]
MTTISARVGIAKMGGEQFRYVEAVVDVWADHSVFPVAVLNELGIEPACQLTVELPDGSNADWGYGVVLLEIGDWRWPCPVVFGPNDEYRLGDSTLQIFNIEPDYNAGELAPAGPLSLGRREDISPNEFARLTAVAPREGYRIWLHYEDGVAGEIDLSHLAESELFKGWHDRRYFESLRIGAHGGVEWDDDVALCGDALYLELTGQVV